MLQSRSLSFLAPVLAAGLFLLPTLAGCGGGSPPVAGAPQMGRAAAVAGVPARMNASGCGKSVVYVTSYDNSVYIYNQKHNGAAFCGQITGLTNPQGLFVDKHGNLWVAIAGDCRNTFSSVLEFAPGGSSPIKTLQDPAGPATDVVVDNKSGTVYVTDFFGYAQGCGSGNNGVVEVYSAGSTTPTATLSDPNMNYAFNDAIDNHGNLYVTFLKLNGPTGSGRVNEWVGGSGSAVDLGITLQAPGGIQTTKSGALLVCDQSAACGEFAPGSTTMTNLFASSMPGSFGVALDKREKHAWVENAGYGLLQRYKYPGPDAHPQQSITVPNGGYAGVAVSPAAPQGAPY